MNSYMLSPYINSLALVGANYLSMDPVGLSVPLRAFASLSVFDGPLSLDLTTIGISTFKRQHTSAKYNTRQLRISVGWEAFGSVWSLHHELLHFVYPIPPREPGQKPEGLVLYCSLRGWLKLPKFIYYKKENLPVQFRLVHDNLKFRVS